jgi:hypothetical protein
VPVPGERFELPTNGLQNRLGRLISFGACPFALHMSANDPKRTLR